MNTNYKKYASLRLYRMLLFFFTFVFVVSCV